MKKLKFLALLMTVCAIGYSQNYQDTISEQLNDLAMKTDLPGFGVAIVSKDSILYKNGFGYADIERKKRYTVETTQNIGSISKTFIALALMQLVEQGKLKLDDDINQYLPFKIMNPHFPNSRITIRQLATHTSSLTDGANDMLVDKSYIFTEKTNFKKEELPEEYFELFIMYNKNKKMPMGQFLHNVYCPEGDWYETTNFLEKEPGTTYEYTNIGSALLAYLIEQVSGKTFDEYTQQYILKPLQMNRTAWFAPEANSLQVATLYLSNGQSIPAYSLITYPDGGLTTSIEDFSLYLIEMIKGKNGEGKLLSFDGYDQVMSNQLMPYYFPNGNFENPQGLMWGVNEAGTNIGANGADPGIYTETVVTTNGNIGVVIFSNISCFGTESLEAETKKIRKILFKYVKHLKT